uniref:Uncharacterized protein n=1 Tax=Rhizophora mucronata TaxID=61149 RepID=A0A2P2IX70_RHIMU
MTILSQPSIWCFCSLNSNSTLSIEHVCSPKSRIARLVSFLIYMITTYSLYVPDWSFPRMNIMNQRDTRSDVG